jgi:hypothetical protein
LLGSLAGTSRRSPSSWALLPWQWSKQNSPWISSTNWGDSLCTIVHRACCPVHVRVGPFCLMITFKCLVGGWWFRTNYIIFRNAEIFLFK